MTGWQPIETAPRDGTVIMLYSPNLGVCFGDVDTRLKQDRYRWDKFTEWGGPDNTEGLFTHWQPLPEPPQAD